MANDSYVQHDDTIVENRLPYSYMGNLFDTIIEDTILTTTNHWGCDSVIDYSLMVYYNKDTLITKDICENMFPYNWNGGVYDSAGVYYTYLLTSNGADSIVGMNLVVHPTYNIEVNDCVCEGHTYSFGGVEYSESGEYSYVFKTKQYNCDSIVHLVLDKSILDAYLSVNPITVTYDDSRVTLIDESVGGIGRIWYLPDRISNEKILEYDYPLLEDSVVVCMVAMDNWNCLDTAKVTLRKSARQLWAPNVFTPDLETNNLFRIYGEGLLDIDVMIFNRHGQLVYQYQSLDEGWNGITRDGIKCPQATYVYKAKYRYKSLPNRVEYKVGTVTLLR